MDESKKLKEYWYSDGWIDYEYKKYTLLAYLQQADVFFKQSKIYPVLSELIKHYNHLNHYKSKKHKLENKLNKEIESIDLKKMKIIFKQQHFSDKFIHEIMKIVDFAQTEIKKSIEHGEEIYQHINSKMIFDTVGLIPFYNKEGYLLISRVNDNDLKIYRYQYSYIRQENDLYHNLKTNEVQLKFNTLSNSLSNVKLQLIKRFKDLPNPATYSLHSHLNISYKHSILPIAKRWLIKEIASAA
jgi:hypothetical protein